MAEEKLRNFWVPFEAKGRNGSRIVGGTGATTTGKLTAECINKWQKEICKDGYVGVVITNVIELED